jgi:hypothetical protein
MTNQYFRREAASSARAHEGLSESTTKGAQDRLSSASSIAEEAGEKVKQAASDTATSLAGEMKQLLNRQVGSSADMLGCAARSARLAAADLERESPAIAGLVRTFASRVDGYAIGLRGQSVDQIWQNATDFTRRQPALVFGLAALAGFFALRLVKSSPPMSAPSSESSRSYTSGRGGVTYGS